MKLLGSSGNKYRVGLTVFHQLNAKKQAMTANVTDDWKLLFQSTKTFQQMVTDFWEGHFSIKKYENEDVSRTRKEK